MVGILVALVIGLGVGLIIVLADDDNNGGDQPGVDTLPTITEQAPTQTVTPTVPTTPTTPTTPSGDNGSGGVAPP
jgi:hypothetical protein